MGRPEFAAVHKHLEADALAHRQRPEVDLFEDDPLAHGPQGAPWGLQAQWERGEKLKKIFEEEQKVRSAQQSSMQSHLLVRRGRSAHCAPVYNSITQCRVS